MGRICGINRNPLGFSLLLLLLLFILHTVGCKIGEQGLLRILFTVTVCLNLPELHARR
jgi:hypothetical protein